MSLNLDTAGVLQFQSSNGVSVNIVAPNLAHPTVGGGRPVIALSDAAGAVARTMKVEESGSLVTMTGGANGYTITLPAANAATTPAGVCYDFVAISTIGAGGATISDGGARITGFKVIAGAAANCVGTTLTFAATVATAGSKASFVSDGVKWHCVADSATAAAITIL